MTGEVTIFAKDFSGLPARKISKTIVYGIGNGSAAGGAVVLEVLGAATHPALAATDIWLV